MEVEPNDWVGLDEWWSAYLQKTPIAGGDDSVVDTTGLATSWEDLDSWWKTYVCSSLSPRDLDSVRGLVTEPVIDWWNDIDPWWEVHAKVGRETAAEIADLLNQSNDEWSQSEGPFDTDPLAADLTLDRLSRGPFQPTGEVEWSQWLAQLLRPSAELTAELFDLEVTHPPQKVVREEQLSKAAEEDGSFRRPDILVFHTDRGISIEVKLDDEEYRKTAETAKLVERHHEERDWTHTLLLPDRKGQRLESIVDPPISSPSDGYPQIEWNDPGSVTVLYWRDVTAAIRSLLYRDEIVDDHWAATAYLFCSVAEQQLMGFKPHPVVERLAAPRSALDPIRPIRLASDLEEQLTYLRTRRSP